MLKCGLRLEAFLPDGLHTVAEVIEDMTSLDAAASGEEAADDTSDVSRDIELLRIIDTYTFHAKAESADAWEDNRLPFDLYREGIFYYGTSKYRHENDGASAPVQCMLDLMMWDATDRMALIDQPLLLMTGEISDSKYMTDEAMEKATGTTRKEMYVIPGASHIKTYYVPEFVEQERAKLIEFFAKYL